MRQETISSSTSILSEIKPVGVQLILDPNTTSTIELMRLVLFDLVYRQVLVLKKELKKSHPRDPYLREYIIIETGKNFAKYTPHNFEKYFIANIDEDTYFIAKAYLRKVSKIINEKSQYKQQIIRDLKMRAFFKNNMLLYMLSITKTNRKGKELKVTITEYLNKMDKMLQEALQNQPDKAVEIIKDLKSNIFLLKNLNFELFEKLSVHIKTPHAAFDPDWYWVDYIASIDANTAEIIFETSEIFNELEIYYTSPESNGDSDYDTGSYFDF
ncbi:hypothetical protein [Aquimarina algicola]|uniref:Uncharacterized protein n=1 Tax=Aquimarina algicola TaxID=2589995 RepID=A0A504J1A4_9FLAO|nr:hypothetical protein [Aquimarina algicola]TPN82385.1 hypothetical protein FHK87_23480 [Aquimarina algicola]